MFKNTRKPLIVGITASSRSVLRNDGMKSIFNNISDELELKTLLQEMSHFRKKISNSDGALISAFFGAKHFECSFLLFNLRDIFDTSRKKSKDYHKNKEKLIESIKNCDGILISTPVYFGDCSSYIYELFRLEDNGNHNIFNEKVVGVLSSGAKRNGGQETTNIFTLYEFFRQGANIIGNGPPTSQYGGTIWAGDKGGIGDDSLGIETAIGTGKKMGEILSITNSYVNNGNDNEKLENLSDNYINLAIILPEKKLLSEKIRQDIQCVIEKTFDEALKKNKIILKINYVEIKDDIRRCMGCDKCPPDRNDLDCIINDNMRSFRSILLSSDSILFINYIENSGNIDTWLNFKIFLERTRHLRHNNFELTNKPVSIITIMAGDCNFESNLRDIKFITYFLRHNTICVGPPVAVFLNNSLSKSGISCEFKNTLYGSVKIMLTKLFKFSHMIKTTNVKKLVNTLYIPYGFGKFKNH
ncbi:MAG: NAD(P)H-dependent oxidoreductase [bacterium]